MHHIILDFTYSTDQTTMSFFSRQHSAAISEKMKSDSESDFDQALVQSPPKKVKHWYSRHPQVYYCKKVPTQLIDVLFDIPGAIPMLWGIIDMNKCESAPSLPFFCMTYSACLCTIAVLRYIFRIPQFGWICGIYDPTYVCTKAVGTLAILVGFLGFWSAPIVIPNISQGFTGSDYTTTSSTTTGTFTGSQTGTSSSLLGSKDDWQCDSTVYISSFICTITALLTLAIATVTVIYLAFTGGLVGDKCLGGVVPGFFEGKKEEEEEQSDESSAGEDSEDSEKNFFADGEHRAAPRDTVVVDRPTVAREPYRMSTNTLPVLLIPYDDLM